MSTNIDRIQTTQFKMSQRLSSGKKINSAADDAAGLAISGKMESQARGLAQGSNNASDMKNLLRTAEGGLDNIADALQRIRELSVQAKNDTNSKSDKQNIQYEVSSLLDFINSAAKGAQYNAMNLLDGSYTDKNAAISPDGSGMTVNIDDSAVIALGLNGYDVTGNFDMSRVDKALDLVNSARSAMGAQQNRLDYAINANDVAYINQMQAQSRIADADMAKAITEKSRADVLTQYQLFSQKEKMAQAGSFLNLLN